jgi:SAM-dependent methyltransferase
MEPSPVVLRSLVESRDRLKALEADLFKRAAEGDGVFLNLGSGKRLLQGFVNIDRYTVLPAMLKADIYRLPVKSDTVDGLFSAHSLEHLPIRRAVLALRDWFRVLKPGGTLLLSMPDIDMIMGVLLRKDLSAQSRRWFLYTLFGYQADMESGNSAEDPPVDPGQFHTCGYSKRTIVDELSVIGYKVQEAENYEGYGTPGLYVVAAK